MCLDRCSPNCFDDKCNQTGFCSGGCVKGWTGHFCEGMSLKAEYVFAFDFIITSIFFLHDLEKKFQIFKIIFTLNFSFRDDCITCISYNLS